MNSETPIDRLRRWFLLKPEALRTILAINVVAFVVVLLVGMLGSGVFREQLALHPEFPKILSKPWQVFTYSILHLPDRGFFFALIHLSFNMFWLVWLGEEYEQLFGARKLWFLYGGAAICGAVLTILLYAIPPNQAAFGGPVYGASAAVVGVVTAVAMHFPLKRIGLLFIGMIPLRTALLVFLVLDVLLGLGGGSFFVSHLGGALFGVGFARLATGAHHSHSTSRSGPQGKGLLTTLESWLGNRNTEKPERQEESRVEEGGAEDEVDRILDKISADGYEALSEEEKRTLYEASKR